MTLSIVGISVVSISLADYEEMILRDYQPAKPKNQCGCGSPTESPVPLQMAKRRMKRSVTKPTGESRHIPLLLPPPQRPGEYFYRLRRLTPPQHTKCCISKGFYSSNYSHFVTHFVSPTNSWRMRKSPVIPSRCQSKES